MPCSCKNKPAMRNTMPRQGSSIRPVVGPVARGVQGGIAAGPSPLQIRQAQMIATNTTPTQQRSPAGMNAERRLVEQKRRTALRSAFNK